MALGWAHCSRPTRVQHWHAQGWGIPDPVWHTSACFHAGCCGWAVVTAVLCHQQPKPLEPSIPGPTWLRYMLRMHWRS